MALRDQLLAAAETYCAKHRISKAALGQRVMNDNKFFARIERGGGFNISTFEKFMAVFAEPPAATEPQRPGAAA